MKTMIIALAATAAFVASVEAKETWQFSSSQGDWGRTCAAYIETGPITVGFKMMPGATPVAFINGAQLPENLKSTWQVAGYQSRHYAGAVDQLSGQTWFGGVNWQFVHEVADGHQLGISLTEAGSHAFAEYGTIRLPLLGSEAAIEQMGQCAGVAFDRQPTASVAGRASETSQTPSKAVAVPTTQQPQPAPQHADTVVPATALLPYEVAMDRLTTYASVLGRGMGCRISVAPAAERVTHWMYRSFGAEDLKVAQVVFLTGTELAARQQMSGQSPDTCASLVSTIETFPWP